MLIAIRYPPCILYSQNAVTF